MRVLFGWGSIRDEDWPNARHSGPEPFGLDKKAKAGRINAYFRVDTLEAMRRCLAFTLPCLVQAAFPVTHDWFNAPEGHINVPDSAAPVIGTHVITLAGYSDTKRIVDFINCWGPSWGNNGCGTFSYPFFRKQLKEAWSMLIVPQPEKKPRGGVGRQVLNWGLITPIGPMHGIEIYDADQDERQAWALMSEAAGVLEIQDLFVKPAWRRMGLANRLVDEIGKISAARRCTVRGHVYPIDARLLLPPIQRLATRLGLVLGRSEVPWARYVARSSKKAS